MNEIHKTTQYVFDEYLIGDRIESLSILRLSDWATCFIRDNGSDGRGWLDEYQELDEHYEMDVWANQFEYTPTEFELSFGERHIELSLPYPVLLACGTLCGGGPKDTACEAFATYYADQFRAVPDGLLRGVVREYFADLTEEELNDRQANITRIIFLAAQDMTEQYEVSAYLASY